MGERSPKKDGGIGSGLLGGIVGGCVFLLFWIFLEIPLAWSLGAGLASAAASLIVARALSRPEGEDREPAIGEYVDKQLARSTIAKAKEGARALLSSCEAMEPGAIRDKFSKLAAGLEGVADDVREDPKDALSASLFLSSQGEAASRMAELYLRLRKRGLSAAENEATIAKLAGLLDRMIADSRSKLQKLQADEWDELRTEMDLVEETIAMDSELEKGSTAN